MAQDWRNPRPGYISHDHCTEWQECDTCGLRTGACITTDYDEEYYAQDNPSECPRCDDGMMCLPDDTGNHASTARVVVTIPRETSDTTVNRIKAYCDNLPYSDVNWACAEFVYERGDGLSISGLRYVYAQHSLFSALSDMLTA